MIIVNFKGLLILAGLMLGAAIAQFTPGSTPLTMALSAVVGGVGAVVGHWLVTRAVASRTARTHSEEGKGTT